MNALNFSGIGNGESTIEELVSEKNKDPLRGKGYKTPLEKIKLGEIEEMFLKNQGLSFKSIPKNGEKIYLRENSNISTGGDSIDFTDKIHPSYKEVALKSAKAVKALICGVDMVIDNIEEEAKEKNHGIIELNFNPAIHIHCFPYKGENRKAGEKILDLFNISCNKYVVADKRYYSSQPIPKQILEFLGFLIVVLLIVGAVILYGENGMLKIMPLITVFFIGLYRILPSLNRAVSYYQNIVFYRQSLNIIAKELEKSAEELGEEKIEFNESITLKNLTFEYEEGKEILKNISLIIQKGERIAFVGESGSGKTTLVDSIIGLYKQKGGEIYIDDILLTDDNIRSWRCSIGYIPQEVYLFDGTVEDNIVFGREYDSHKLEKALKKAQIWEFLQKKNGVKTIVGDKGIMLSGGQKQRLAIARALYNNPEILVLDEATSALDNVTEYEIQKALEELSKDRTTLVVAHRLSTVKNSDEIVVLTDKGIEERGTHEELIKLGGVYSNLHNL